MKTLTRAIQIIVSVATLFAAPRVAWALGSSAFVVNPQVSGSQSLGSTVVGTAYSTNFNVQLQMGSTVYKGGGVTFENLTVLPATLQVTATMLTNGPFTSTQSTGTWTTNTSLTVSATASAAPGTYTVTFTAASTNLAHINSSISGTPNIGPPTGNPVTNKYTFTVGTPVTPVIIWSPAGVDTNWSNPNNWNTAATPNSGNDVYFIDLGLTTAGIVDNVVNSNMSIGSLTYANTNNFHTTLIQSNATLTVGGDAIGLIAGTGTDPGPASSQFGYTTSNSITGMGGMLSITNPNAVVFVSQTHVTTANAVSLAWAALDLSGLDTFRATVAGVRVGSDSFTVSKGQCGILNLAKTNTITLTPGSTAPQIDVGDNNQSGDTPTLQSRLLLGQTNGIYADSITVGRGKTDADPDGALMAFNSALTAPTAYFRGTGGAASRVGTWTIGDGGAGRTYYAYGTCDFSLGTVNALVDTMYIGKGATGSSPQDTGYGTLTFGAGTIDVNTLEVGYTTIGPGIGSDTGTVNVNGGSLVVNTFLELAHGNNSSGTLNLSNATLTANNGITPDIGLSAISLTDSTLNATNNTAVVGSGVNPVSSFSISDSTLNVSVHQNKTPNVSVADLSAGGTANTISFSAVPPLPAPGPAQFPVIQYGLNGGGSSGNLNTFVVGTLPTAIPPYSAFVSNNVANNSIDIVFIGGPFVPALTWDGTLNGNWNTTTPNWKSGATFAQNDFVTFDDTLTGTANTNVNLSTALSSDGVTVNNSLYNYAFGGGGSISGSGTLFKSGSGTLTLAETGGDNFSGGIIINSGTLILDNVDGAISGGTVINGGTVQVGNNDANGALPAGNVADNGTLIFDRPDNITNANVISGAGTLTQSGTGAVTLGVDNNDFSGPVAVAQGTLRIGSTNALAPAVSSVTVNNGGTFDVNGYALFGNGNSNLVVYVSGAGVGGNGAIVNNGTNNLSSVFHTINLTADATFGGNANWDLRNNTAGSAGADGALNGAFNLTKVGTNTVTLKGLTVDTSLGNINVQAGTLVFSSLTNAPINSLGSPSATATVFTNATLTLDSMLAVPDKIYVLTNGGTLKCTGTNTLGINSPLTLAGAAANTINVNSTNNVFTINSVIGGTGSLTKSGSGILFLTTNNTYVGRTTVSSGTLALTTNGSGNGSIAFSTNINITSGATIDVSGRSDDTLTLASGQTLAGGVGTNGPGTINGILITSAGSTVSPGSGTTNIGTLSVISNVTLQGVTMMKISAAGGNDQIDAAGITYGGTLIVTNFSGVVTNGQSFQLFIATNGNYSAGTFSSVILPSATGPTWAQTASTLTWTDTLTVNGKITAVITLVQPVITGISLSGTGVNNLGISGTNGSPGYNLVLLNSTNVALPLNQWTPMLTNPLTAGNISVTATVNTNAPQNFYILEAY